MRCRSLHPKLADFVYALPRSLEDAPRALEQPRRLQQIEMHEHAERERLHLAELEATKNLLEEVKVTEAEAKAGRARPTAGMAREQMAQKCRPRPRDL